MDTKSSYESAHSLDTLSDKLNASGFSPKELIRREDDCQRGVADNKEWCISKKTKYGKDSKKELRRVGLRVIGTYTIDLFYTVRQPKGWTKSTVGMWTTVLDDKGNLILTQFYKGSLYDQRAFVDIVKQPANTLERLVEFVEDKIL